MKKTRDSCLFQCECLSMAISSLPLNLKWGTGRRSGYIIMQGSRREHKLFFCFRVRLFHLFPTTATERESTPRSRYSLGWRLTLTHSTSVLLLAVTSAQCWVCYYGCLGDLNSVQVRSLAVLGDLNSVQVRSLAVQLCDLSSVQFRSLSPFGWPQLGAG